MGGALIASQQRCSRQKNFKGFQVIIFKFVAAETKARLALQHWIRKSLWPEL